MGRKAVLDKVRWQIVGLLKDKTKSQKEIVRPSKVNFCQQPELFTEDDNKGYLSTMAQRLTLQSRLMSGLIGKTLRSCLGQLVLQISIPLRTFGLG